MTRFTPLPPVDMGNLSPPPLFYIMCKHSPEIRIHLVLRPHPSSDVTPDPGSTACTDSHSHREDIFVLASLKEPNFRAQPLETFRRPPSLIRGELVRVVIAVHF